MLNEVERNGMRRVLETDVLAALRQSAVSIDAGVQT